MKLGIADCSRKGCKQTPEYSCMQDSSAYQQMRCGCTAGAGPYKTWEKQPLCDEHGGASSSSADDDHYSDKERNTGSMISSKTLQYLVWFNAALFILVVIGGTLLVRSPATCL